MPVEIRELVIRAVVGPVEERAASSPGLHDRVGQGDPVPTQEREAIVADCVREVMRILRHQKER